MKKGSRRKRIRVIVPVSSNEWNVPVKDELERYKDANTEISVVNINEGPKAIECTYDETRAAMPVVCEAERAEKDGYDGVVIYCFADPGARAAKEKLNIPVVGLNEASVHIASLIGTKFGIISTGPVDYYLRDMEELLRLYGFKSKCVSVRSLTIPVLDLQAHKEQQGERLVEEVKKAINDDGVDTIVLGCGGMLVLPDELLELGIPIVLPGIAALKVCEDLIDMNLSQSKRCFNIPAGER
jgi:allantoin racemase